MSTNKKTRPGKLAILIDSHRKIARSCVQDLLASPVATAVTTLVIAFALIFPALLYLLSLNLNASLGQDYGPARFSVFLQNSLSDAEAREVSDRLQTLPAITSMTLIAPEQALEDFSENAELGDLLLTLPENPLPYTLVLTLDPDALEDIEGLRQNIEMEPGVESVQFDLLWLQRVQGFASLLNRLGLVLLVVVIAGLVAIVGNTIKLAVASRQQEIRVIKLVGGSDAFIARPFLYRGALLGLGGAVLACLLISVLLLALAGPVDALSQLYGGEFRLVSLTPLGYLGLLLLGSATGWIAAFISSWRNIAAIEP